MGRGWGYEGEAPLVLGKGVVSGLAWLPRSWDWLTFQPVPVLCHLTGEVAHGPEEAEASAARSPVRRQLIFCLFAPFIGFFNFHNVAAFIRWPEIL